MDAASLELEKKQMELSYIRGFNDGIVFTEKMKRGEYGALSNAIEAAEHYRTNFTAEIRSANWGKP